MANKLYAMEQLTEEVLLYIAHDISLVSLHAVSFEVVGCCSNL